MNIQKTKLELLKTILNTEDSDFIQRVADFIKNEDVDFWNDLSPAQQKEIKKGIEQLDKGQRVTLESFLDKIP